MQNLKFVRTGGCYYWTYQVKNLIYSFDLKYSDFLTEHSGNKLIFYTENVRVFNLDKLEFISHMSDIIINKKNFFENGIKMENIVANPNNFVRLINI